jgi:hypothetical protein
MTTTISGSPGFSGRILLKRVLLVCGILSSLVYVGTDLLAGTLWVGYSFTSQGFSELNGIGSPTRQFVVPLIIAYGALLVAFTLGVWVSAGQNRALRITALMLVGEAIDGLVTPLFFPINMHEAMGTFENFMHTTLTGVGVIFILGSMVLGAAAFRNWFRFYSIGTILALIVTSVVSFSMVASGTSTLWFGVIERILIYAYLLWVAVLAFVLLRVERGGRKS